MESKKGMEMMMVKVDPQGSRAGKAWDEKGKCMLTQIFISYGSMWIRSIQTAHMVGEKLQLSEKHGEDGRMFKTVDIDYPYEFLTGISGFTGSITDSDCNPVLIKRACGNSVVKSLTFETNRRKIGPYGQEEGTPFCIQMGTKRCFGGFHGSSDSTFLYSIGVYSKPFHPRCSQIEGRIP